MVLHTDIPTRRELEKLLGVIGPHCVSIYLPTHRVTAETHRDRPVLRDLTRQAVEQLHDAGVDGVDVTDIEEHLLHLVDQDDEFWADQADSLAVFASPGRFETHRLPNHLAPTVEVADRFHILPLLRAVTFPHAAWVLALSQGAVRLLETGPAGAPEEVRVDDNPETSTDAELAESFDTFRSQGRTAVDVSDIARLSAMGAVDEIARRVC